MTGEQAVRLIQGLRPGYGYAFDGEVMWCCHNPRNEPAGPNHFMRIPLTDLEPIRTKEELIEYVEVQWAIHNVCGEVVRWVL